MVAIFGVFSAGSHSTTSFVDSRTAELRSVALAHKTDISCPFLSRFIVRADFLLFKFPANDFSNNGQIQAVQSLFI